MNNRVWLGLTIGIHDVHYNSNSLYSEDLADGNIADSHEQLRISGTGYDVKAGLIFRPVADSPFRIGAYVNSPIFYDLTLKGDNDISIYGDNEPATYQETDGTQAPCYTKGDRGQSVDYDFRLNTPWKVGVSMGHTVGKSLALGATYEYAWYDHMDNREKTGTYYDYWDGAGYETSTSDEAMNHDTRLNLKGVSTFKVGAEYKPIDMLAIRLGYNYVSPMYKMMHSEIRPLIAMVSMPLLLLTIQTGKRPTASLQVWDSTIKDGDLMLHISIVLRRETSIHSNLLRR